MSTAIGKYFQLHRGESLNEAFAVYDKDGVILQLNGLYTVSAEQEYNQEDNTFVTVSTNSSEEITLTVATATSADTSNEIGIYNVKIFAVLDSDTTQKLHVADVQVQLFEIDDFHLNIDPDRVRDQLNLDRDFDYEKLLYYCKRARTRAEFLVTGEVRKWCRQYGWTEDLNILCNELAKCFLSEYIYPGREDLQDKIERLESEIQNVIIDTDQDGNVEAGVDITGGTVFNIARVEV